MDSTWTALYKFTKQKSEARFIDRLRVSTTVPTLFSLACTKSQREEAQRMLRIANAKFMVLRTPSGEPMLDVVISSFIHFLSRLKAFVAEATVTVSAYLHSSRICTCFVDSLLQEDPARNMEVARLALRVIDRVRHFVDREHPTSDLIHKAANALRYVVEKRCPELGARKGPPSGKSPGSMPADLYALRNPVDALPSHQPDDFSFALPVPSVTDSAVAIPVAADLAAPLDAISEATASSPSKSPCKSLATRKDSGNVTPQRSSTGISTPKRPSTSALLEAMASAKSSAKKQSRVAHASYSQGPAKTRSAKWPRTT